MKAGWGLADMTPPIGVELAGYGYYLERRATHVKDPLYARAVAFAQGEQRYVIISCDVLGLNASIVSTVLCALHSRHGVPVAHTLIVSIHTHTGPAIKYHTGCGEVDKAYAEKAAEPIIQACDRAFADLTEVTALYGGCAPLAKCFAYNRACSEEPVDGLVRAFLISRADASPIAVASYACHPVIRGRSDGISADYPGQVCALLTQKGMLPIYINGLCGDIDPVPCPAQARDTHCDAFAKAITESFPMALHPLPLSIQGKRMEWSLRLPSVSHSDIEKIAIDAIARTIDPGAQKVVREWENEMLARCDTLASEERLSIACLWLGGVPIVAIPFEGFSRIGELIRSKYEDPRTVLLGCAEELLGYLPTLDDIQRKSYAALESFFLYKRLPPIAGEAERLGQDIGEWLVHHQA